MSFKIVIRFRLPLLPFRVLSPANRKSRDAETRRNHILHVLGSDTQQKQEPAITGEPSRVWELLLRSDFKR
jgi:hypothetical protein